MHPAVGGQVIDQVLQHVHVLGVDVVKGDGVVAATVWTLDVGGERRDR